jgi:hypothetical protein
MKLWPRFKTYRWPSYEVPVMCNVMENCRIRKNVANYDRWPGYRGGQLTGGQVIEVANYDRWPGYRGGQLNSFHCTFWPWQHAELQTEHRLVHSQRWPTDIVPGWHIQSALTYRHCVRVVHRVSADLQTLCQGGTYCQRWPTDIVSGWHTALTYRHCVRVAHRVSADLQILCQGGTQRWPTDIVSG